MSLDDLRKKIDTIDIAIIELLAKRFAVVKKIGEYKKLHTLPALDISRWNELVALLKNRAKKK
jgi:chorismate mutase